MNIPYTDLNSKNQSIIAHKTTKKVFISYSQEQRSIKFCEYDYDDPLKFSGFETVSTGSGLVLKNGIEFIFNIGDVVVNDSIIKFIEMHDTIQYQSALELNEVVRTNTFELNNDADFIFSNL